MIIKILNLIKSFLSSKRGLVSSVREAVEDFIPKIEFEHMGVRYLSISDIYHIFHLSDRWRNNLPHGEI